MKKLVLAALLAATLPAIHGCAAVVVGGAATAAVVADDRRKTSVVLEDQEIELRPANSQMASIRVRAEEIEIVGTVVGLLRRYRQRPFRGKTS